MSPYGAAFAIVAMSAVVALATQANTASAGSSGEAEVQMMDTNHDGKVSAEEHAAGARQMFATMDADQDGKVTATEMDSAKMPTRNDAKSSMSSAEKIKVIDKNGDGVVSAEEHEAGSKAMFDRMDADHDGLLTAQEIEAGHAMMMKKKGY
jgi:Ca2+-binding EF-hand superfamily protein